MSRDGPADARGHCGTRSRSTRRRLGVGRRLALACLLLVAVAPGGPPARPVSADAITGDSLRALSRVARHREAETLGRAELARLQGAADVDSLQLADLLDATVEAAWRSQDRPAPELETMAAQAVRLRERGLGPGDPRVAASLTTLGRVQRALRKTEEARTSYERALAIRRAALPADDPEIAVSLTSLGLVLRDLGRLEEARGHMVEALRIRELSLGPAHRDVGAALNNLAITQARLGEFGASANLLARAVGILESTSPVDTAALASALTSQSASLMYLRAWEPARVASARALRLREAILPPRHPLLAQSAENLASSLTHLGRLEEARREFERVLAIVRPLKDVRTAQALMNAARLEWRSSRAESAAALYREAEALFASKPNTLHERAVLQADWAAMHLHLGDLTSMISCLSRSIALRESLGTSLHPDLATCRQERALANWIRGDTATVWDDVRSLFELRRQHVEIAAAALTEREALSYAELHGAALGFAIALVEERPEPGRISQAWTALMGHRGLVLEEMAARRRVLAMAHDSAGAALAERREGAARRLATIAFTAGAGSDAGLASAREERARVETEIAARRLAPQGTGDRPSRAIEDVTSALAGDQALVAFVRYPRRERGRVATAIARARQEGADAKQAFYSALEPAYAAFVARGDGHAARFVALPSADRVDSLVSRWRTEASRPSRARQARAAGEALRRAVWDPIASALGDAALVFVVPDGTLPLVNLAALPARGGGYLVESGPTLHLLDRERDLLRRRPTGGSPALLAIGGVDFARSGDGGRPKSHGPPPYRSATSSCEDFSRARFEPLPSSRLEAEEVAERWRRGGGAAEVWSGQEATEAAFKAAAGGHRVVHIATHGFFLPDDCPVLALPEAAESPLLRSGLVLAGGGRRDPRPPDGEDGILTAEEIATLDLSGVGLVVLSACHTAEGTIRQGEGVFGLRRAFQVAGAASQVMSLWRIDDLAARRWMELFYDAHARQGSTLAGSVRNASRALLAEMRARGDDPGPAAWGAFIASGDWR